jgi:hypothetical protein
MNITALKYEDENVIDFGTTQDQKRTCREMVTALGAQTGEDWSHYLSEVDVEIADNGNITYNGSIYAPTETDADGFYIAI